MHPSTIKQNYTLAKLLEIDVHLVLFACLSSTTAWDFINRIKKAPQANKQVEIDAIRNAIFNSFKPERAFS